jgi:hypothetical protein
VRPLAPPPAWTLVTPYCKRTRPRRGTNMKAAGFPPLSLAPAAFPPPSRSVSRRPIWAGARGDISLVSPGTPRSRNADTAEIPIVRPFIHSSYSSFVHRHYSSLGHTNYSPSLFTVTIHRYYSSLLFIVTIHRSSDHPNFNYSSIMLSSPPKTSQTHIPVIRTPVTVIFLPVGTSHLVTHPRFLQVEHA